MAQNYYTTGNISDLSNATATANYALAYNNTGASTNITSPTLASGGTVTYSFFTPALHPGTDGNITGNYSFLFVISTANANISGTCTLNRVNSSGVVQTSSAASASQSFGTTGTKTYSFTALSLGTFVSTDRVRVDILATSSAMNSSFAFTLNNGTSGLYTPYNARLFVLS